MDVYVGIQVCSVSIAIVLTGYLHSQFNNYLTTLPTALGLMFLVVVIFRQLIPRICTFHKPEGVVLTLLPSYRLLRPVLKVLAFPLASSLRLFRRFNAPEAEEEKTEQHIEEEIQAFIDVGQEEGILKKGEGRTHTVGGRIRETVAGTSWSQNPHGNHQRQRQPRDAQAADHLYQAFPGSGVPGPCGEHRGFCLFERPD